MIQKTFENVVTTASGGQFKLYYLIENRFKKKIIVLTKNLNNNKNPLIRIQFGCLFGTTFGLLDCDCDLQLQQSLKEIDKYDNGALIYFPDDDGRGIGLAKKMDFLKLQRQINEPPIKTARIFHIKYEDFSILDTIPDLLELLEISAEIIVLSNSPQKLEYLKKLKVKVKETRTLAVKESTLTKKAKGEIDEKHELLGHFSY